MGLSMGLIYSKQTPHSYLGFKVWTLAPPCRCPLSVRHVFLMLRQAFEKVTSDQACLQLILGLLPWLSWRSMGASQK